MKLSPSTAAAGIIASGALLLDVATASLYGQSNLNHTCPIKQQYLSCSAFAQPNVTDSCCTETFGGLVLATQFWDTYTGLEAQGQVLPKDTWTIHGLWPDYCNGSYTQYCDISRQYDPIPSPNVTDYPRPGTLVPAYNGTSIAKFLEPFGKYDLLEYMNKYWVAQAQPNGDFWGHEFSKHATCFSSFDLPCYGPQYQKHEEVVDFFETTIKYHEPLPTYDWLAAQGVTPSNTTTYSLSQFQSALSQGFGALPYLGCSGPRFNATAAGNGTLDNGRTEFTEAWYYYHVYGRVQDVRGIPVNASINGGSVSSCAKTAGALHYYERTPGSEV
ncbi:Ribonuclease Le2 [Phlyctema vagabunda]|uniref:ribonuclease T2 n=1 Tax=Phlyctema vagabunda TaxID=108571 RepID=A0ABR4PII4_9HELO